MTATRFVKTAAAAELERRLHQVAGGVLVPHEAPATLLEMLLRGGALMRQRITHRPMAPNACHLNVGELWRRPHHGGLTKLGTGYALHEGFWYRHSWGLDGTIVETTALGWTHYFGVSLTGQRADTFAAVAGQLTRTGIDG